MTRKLDPQEETSHEGCALESNNRPTSGRRRRSRSRSRNKTKSHFRWKRLFLRLFLLGVVCVAAVCGVYAYWASTFDLNGTREMKERSTVHDMDGKVWGRLQGENRVPVKKDEVSKNFIACLLAREDTRFYSHFGVDLKGVARALVRNAQGTRQGASTITQQLVRNSYDNIGTARTLHRKLLELFVALRVERNYSKDAIMELYMNRIYFGSGVYGIEMASKVYFGKSASALTLSEAAMIAGIIRAPSNASPNKNMKRAQAERDMVLARLSGDDLRKLREQFGITPDQIGAAKNEPLKIVRKQLISTQENYAMDAVLRDLMILLDEDQQTRGGLKIYTTIDPQLQLEAQKTLDQQLAKVEGRPGYPHLKKSEFTEEMRMSEQPTDYLQGAAIVLDNRSGGIRAIVGGRDYRESKFNRALDAKRQIGSTFKPFVYAAAFAHGFDPQTLVSDAAIARGEIADAPNWTPDNSDGKYGGLISMEDGLVLSRNTATVRVGERTGVNNVQKVANAVGLEEMPALPVAYMGTFGATLKDVATAYSIFPNRGIRHQSYIIERIDSAEGEVLYRAGHLSLTALEDGVCSSMNHVLQKVFERGTAASAKALGWNKTAAGKTGTTNDYHDAWFVGYTSTLTCGVWVGLDKPATIVPRGYGATLALPIWVDIMGKASTQRYPADDFRAQGSRFFGDTRTAPDVVNQPPAKPKGGILRSFRKFFSGD